MAKKQLGRYEIIERLGRGGMAEVYRAYQASLDRHVAIKLLHPFLADDPEFKDRFEREARNVARLRHPNIVQVYDFEYDHDSESYYMVMELINGQTLKDRLEVVKGEPLPLDETLRIMRGSVQALAYAHARGMIHRDVKPANLMIDEDGRVVLTDFGIAKIVTGVQFTASGGMVGTPAYMAPEQGLGEAGDERSDLYSLGVIMFHLVTGKLPYDADTPLALILKHLNEPTPIAREVRSDVPESISAIIAKAMDKDPQVRYQRAEEMLVDLNDASGIPTDPALLAALNDPDRKFDSSLRPPSGLHKALANSNKAATDKPGINTTVARFPRPASVGLSAIIIVIILALLGFLLANGNLGDLIQLISSTRETPTAISVISSNTPVDSPVPTLSPTVTPTPSKTASPTATPTITSTPTPNLTQTYESFLLTSLAQTISAVVETPKRQTPTLDLTGTFENCTREYRSLIPVDPREDDQKNWIVANTEFTREIRIRNISNCDWLPDIYIEYISGERFGAPRKIEATNKDIIRPNEDAIFLISGRSPIQGRVHRGMWEVRLAGGVLVQPPLEIRFFVYEG